MARSMSPHNGYQNLMCKEFCGGSLAVCYCPQCSAIFCSDCFNREHQTERKMRHEKVFDVKPICQDHHHTLEYFDLTSFKPLCIMCLTKLHLDKELEYHVIQNINSVSPKLYSLLMDKLREAKDVAKNIQDGVKLLKETTENGLKVAKDEIHSLIDHFKVLLDEREKEVIMDLEGACHRYLAKEESTGLLSLEQRLEDSIKQAERLVQSQKHETIGYEFPYFYNKLNDLCSVASRSTESRRELKLTVNVSKTTLHGMQNICEVVPTVKTATECESDNDNEDLESLCHGVVKVKLIDGTMTTTEHADLHDNASTNNDDVDVDGNDTTVTPIEDADFYDNEPTTDDEHVDVIDTIATHIGDADFYDNEPTIDDEHYDVSDTIATTSEMTDHHDNIPPDNVDHHMVTDPIATPLTGINVCSPRPGIRRLKLPETKKYENTTRFKTGKVVMLEIVVCKKRHLKSVPTDDWEWTPKRILRSSTRDDTTRGTGAKSRTARGGALSREMNQCDAILTLLWAEEDSWPFVRPVDKKKYPDYYEKIRHPSCLEIVKEKLHSYQYRSVVDFVRDINQILENCRVFNEPGSDVHQSGNRLAQLFRQLLNENFPNFDSVFQNQTLMDSSL
ncbi:hypothetical protein QZH41_013219 [Actinostola sp. cb2023]|nr:hypothetical protein QZH41_013219 [Actinostola sp. cb2023]